MIDAMLVKRAASRGYVSLDRRDLDAVASSFHKDAVWEYPGERVLGGRAVGRAAVREWFRTYFDLMPEARFTVRHAAVEDIFALTGTNNGYLEWRVDRTDLGGQRKDPSRKGRHLRPGSDHDRVPEEGSECGPVECANAR